MNDRDLDAEFERIIAGFDADADVPDLAVPEADSAEPATDRTDPAPPDTGLGLPIAASVGHAWRGQEPPVDDVDAVLEHIESDDPDGEHFVPGEPDLPSAEDDPMFWAIVGGLVGGPLLLLWLFIFDSGGSGWWFVTAIALIVVGFVLLVLRGGTERNPFDDGTRI